MNERARHPGIRSHGFQPWRVTNAKVVLARTKKSAKGPEGVLGTFQVGREFERLIVV